MTAGERQPLTAEQLDEMEARCDEQSHRTDGHHLGPLTLVESFFLIDQARAALAGSSPAAEAEPHHLKSLYMGERFRWRAECVCGWSSEMFASEGPWRGAKVLAHEALDAHVAASGVSDTREGDDEDVEDAERVGYEAAPGEVPLIVKCAQRMAAEGLDHHPVGLRRGEPAECGCPSFLDNYPAHPPIVVHGEDCVASPVPAVADDPGVCPACAEGRHLDCASDIGSGAPCPCPCNAGPGSRDTKEPTT